MLSEIKYEKQIQGEVIDFTQMECGNCGIPFFVPTRWRRNKIEAHGSFHCPNGCVRVYLKQTEAEKLKEEIENLKLQKEKEHEELQNKWLDAVIEKNKVEKRLKRVNKGVCPCCNRTFINVQLHMKTKHPEAIK